MVHIDPYVYGHGNLHKFIGFQHAKLGRGHFQLEAATEKPAPQDHDFRRHAELQPRRRGGTVPFSTGTHPPTMPQRAVLGCNTDTAMQRLALKAGGHGKFNRNTRLSRKPWAQQLSPGTELGTSGASGETREATKPRRTERKTQQAHKIQTTTEQTK